MIIRAIIHHQPTLWITSNNNNNTAKCVYIGKLCLGPWRPLCDPQTTLTNRYGGEDYVLRRGLGKGGVDQTQPKPSYIVSQRTTFFFSCIEDRPGVWWNRIPVLMIVVQHQPAPPIDKWLHIVSAAQYVTDGPISRAQQNRKWNLWSPTKIFTLNCDGLERGRATRRAVSLPHLGFIRRHRQDATTTMMGRMRRAIADQRNKAGEGTDGPQQQQQPPL